MGDYQITTGEGGIVADVQAASTAEAKAIAREWAKILGQSMFLAGPGIEIDPDDDEDIGIEVRPPRKA